MIKLVDEVPADGKCTDCRTQLQKDITGATGAGFSVYLHMCPKCQKHYLRIFKND